jgi:hypothetical protein
MQRRLEDFLHTCDLTDTDRAHIAASLIKIQIMQRTRQPMHSQTGKRSAMRASHLHIEI